MRRAKHPARTTALTYYNVSIMETGESYRCSDQETLLAGMERLGRKGIPVGCRGGGCGICKIQIVSGAIEKRVMSRQHVSHADEAAGRVLACRVRPAGDITLSVLGKMKKSVCSASSAQTHASVIPENKAGEER